jgi:lipid-binding SYLF domain-containing protein
MIRYLFAALLALLPLAAHAQTEQQTLVDRATLSVQEMLGTSGGIDVHSLVRRAKGVLVCPRLFKVGFFFGGQGGGCVLVGRVPGDGWSGPAFYGLGSGSFGLQIGVQDSEIIFIVLTNKGLAALMNSQFKFGADADIAVATIGGGIQGSTTAALMADIVAVARNRGLFAGVSLEGSIMGARGEWNQAYYGQPLSAQQIVIQLQGQNPGDAPLREVLARFSGGGPAGGPAGGPGGAPAGGPGG